MRNGYVRAAIAAAVTLGLLLIGSVVVTNRATAPQGGPTGTGAQSPQPSEDQGPEVSWDWRMPANIVDRQGWDFATQELAGPPDGLPDKRMRRFSSSSRGGTYRPGGRGQYGEIPADGLHTVVLDATASTGSGRLRCSWKIFSEPSVTLRSAPCGQEQRVRLPEGTHDLRLTVTDRRGKTKVRSRITVRNVLIALMGDSYSAGNGFPPYRVGGTTGPDSEFAWDDAGCTRTRWGGFVRAALALESADPRSNVTLVNVSCSGARVGGADGTAGGGIIAPQQVGSGVRPAQVDQVNEIVGNARIDLVLLSIGGNDAGFGEISRTCGEKLFGGADLCYNTPKDGMPLWRWVDDQLGALGSGYQAMARCLSPSVPGSCRTAQVPGGPMARTRPLPVATTSRILQSAYPNLTARAKKPGENGNGGADWVNCSFRAIPEQPDADGTYTQAPLMPWDGDWVMRAAYDGRAGQRFTPSGSPDPGAAVGPLQADGLNRLIRRNSTDFGFTITEEIYQLSGEHGACATAPGMVPWVNGLATGFGGAPQDGAGFLGAILHPTEAGQEAYSRALAEPAKRIAGVPVPRPGG